MKNSGLYERFVSKMNALDLNMDDENIQKQQIKSICTHFLDMVDNEEMLHESMEYINEKALGDNCASIRFAMIFSSCFFEGLAMKGVTVRSIMISLLKKNFKRFEHCVNDDKEKLYNSITLLGECYNRYKTAKNEPIKVLGNTLLKLLHGIIKKINIDQKAAGVILTQITQNGVIFKDQHKDLCDELVILNISEMLKEPNHHKEIIIVMLTMALNIYNNTLNGELVQRFTDLISRPTEIIVPMEDKSPAKEPSPKKSWRELVDEELDEF
jgi:hypothetical protein